MPTINLKNGKSIDLPQGMLDYIDRLSKIQAECNNINAKIAHNIHDRNKLHATIRDMKLEGISAAQILDAFYFPAHTGFNYTQDAQACSFIISTLNMMLLYADFNLLSIHNLSMVLCSLDAMHWPMDDYKLENIRSVFLGRMPEIEQERAAPLVMFRALVVAKYTGGIQSLLPTLNTAIAIVNTTRVDYLPYLKNDLALLKTSDSFFNSLIDSVLSSAQKKAPSIKGVLPSLTPEYKRHKTGSTTEQAMKALTIHTPVSNRRKRYVPILSVPS